MRVCVRMWVCVSVCFILRYYSLLFLLLSLIFRVQYLFYVILKGLGLSTSGAIYMWILPLKRGRNNLFLALGGIKCFHLQLTLFSDYMSYIFRIIIITISYYGSFYYS